MKGNSYAWYSTESKPISELLASKCSDVEADFDKEFGSLFSALIRIMDNTYKLYAQHFWILANPHLAHVHKNSTILMSAVGKNFFVLHSALMLTRSGLYGPARTLLRHVFGYLVVAKYCALSEDDRVFGRWDSGDTVYFTKGVLNKIVKPDNKELKDFWNLMCKYSHSTNTSQQIVVEWKGCEEDIYVTLCFIRALLECQYHLLNSVLITKSMRSFALRNDDEHQIPPIREENRKLLKVTRSSMGKKARDLVRRYVAAWQLDP